MLTLPYSNNWQKFNKMNEKKKQKQKGVPEYGP